MRPITTQSKNRSLKSNTKSMSTLHQLKKTTENFPSLRNDYIVEKYSRGSFKEAKSKGKLHLGNIAKPTIILSKQERLNPWGKRGIISQEILSKKGLLNLMHMGVIAKQFDCMQLLNNRYEIITPKEQPEPQKEKETFMTNPAIMEAYYELSKKNESEQEKTKQKIENKAIKRRSVTKKKVIKQQEPKFQFLIEDKVKLLVLNFHIEQNQTYHQYVKRLKRNGMQHIFKIYAKKVEQFAAKHNLKKITIIPNLDETRKITQKSILSSIVNHKLFGIDKKVKGSCLQIFRWLLLAKVGRLRYYRLQQALKKIENIKNQFKIKKFYREMIDKRWKFVKFKLGSFTQNQRRLVADNMHRNFRPEVQIHILASNSNPNELQTYYKWNERKKAQLTRLYNNESDHIILIINKQENLQSWLQDIQSAPSNWKKPRIHIFSSSLHKSSIQEYADIYFGLQPDHIKEIKRICEGKTAVVIPYFISAYLPNICEALGVNLFAGSFTQQSKNILFQEDEQQRSKTPEIDIKFTKLTTNARDMNGAYTKKYKQIALACGVFESKARVKQLFFQLKIPTPVSISIENTNEGDFFRELVRTILAHKQFSKWILKLPDSNFSRGLAFFETQSLKIIKETKKKPFVKEDDIQQISKIIEAILVQKISIPHNSLMNGDEFISNFKEKEGYFQCLLENCTTLCIFGRIETNGVLSILGSYKKFYAENISFGALYPAEQVTEEMIKMVHKISAKLYQLGVFGYLTFELLLNEKTNEFYFIDLTPHLDQYSSFYFYYRRFLDINELDNVKFTNKLKRYIFYCPFIDNNGNKFETIKDLQDFLQEKKQIFDSTHLEGFKYLFLSQDVPSVLSLISFASEEGNAIKYCLDGLRFLVENGGQFNKFDKKFKNNQSDGLYIMDILWKMRQIKKEFGDK